MAPSTPPTISLVATFPPGLFPENITALPDDTLLVSIFNRRSLFCLPPTAHEGQLRQPFLLERFDDDQWCTGIATAVNNPSVNYVMTTDFTRQGSRTNFLRVLDFANVAAGCQTRVLAQFPPEAKGLNGLVALSNSVLLATDSFAGCIWRIDVTLNEHGIPVNAQVSEWLRDSKLDGTLVLPDFQPGANGIKYSRRANAVCFTSTQQRLFAKIAVDAETLQAKGLIETLHTGAQGDDLIIDDDYAGGPVAYLTTHRDNTILRIPIDGAASATVETVAEGTKERPLAIGPTAGAWKWGEVGKTAYFTADGGLKNPLPGESPRFARVIQVQF